MIDVDDLVAPPNVRPSAAQSRAPECIFNGRKPPVEDSEDLQRVIALPRRAQVEGTRAEALTLMMTERYRVERTSQCECRTRFNRDCITELLPTQAWALHEIGITGGLLGPIGVGHGKTILDLLAPLAVRGCKLAVLLVPPGLVKQLIHDYELVGQHFRMPSLVVHGKDWSNIIPGSPVLHVYPYSRLSRPESTVFLESLKPDLIIADEAHKLRHGETATTSRVIRYFQAHPETRFCAWSGSITDASIKDYWHLSLLALRRGSPLPTSRPVVEDWARAVDAVEWAAPMGALEQLCDDSGEDDVRSAFHRRLVQTKGVVATTSASISTELEILERVPTDVPFAIMSALDSVRETWCRPDGEEFVEQLEVAACLRQIACGFYYRWKFPNGEPEELIDRWRATRKEWHRELRDTLKKLRASADPTAAEHLDSPKLLKNAAQRYHGDRAPEKGLPAWQSEWWPRWRDVEQLVKPETETVRLDPYLVEDAAAWAHEQRGIVWYDSRAFGVWLAEVARLPMIAGGPTCETGRCGICPDCRLKTERGDRSIILSIKAHGTGRNGLQFLYDDQLIAQPPSSSMAWEQLLGRLHRIGQKADIVRARFYRHTEELESYVDAAVRKATYVQGTIGSAQKLRLGME